MRYTMLISSLFLTAAVACTQADTSDDSMYLTGTEEAALTGPHGEPTCEGHKVLICHIPPGNPDNAHTICVGEPAVQPHVDHHGDYLGACVSDPSDDDGGDDGEGSGSGSGSGSDGPIVQ